jgi:hypothetical protein
MLALEFTTPALLIGLLAAGIPLLLHLLSSVKAQEVYFPSLRFLRRSMEKTARRRRLQHWLLLVLRSLLLGLLAVAVAEPITRAAGGWTGGGDYAAVLVIDNSYSMDAKLPSGATRLTAALGQASSVLSGDRRPAMATVMFTSSPGQPKDLTTDVAGLRKTLTDASIGYGRSTLAKQVAAAIEMLAKATAHPRKCIYIFSDMQRGTFDELAAMEPLAAAKDIHLMVVNVAGDRVADAGISDVEVAGRPIIDQPLEITATVVNSSATDRKVNVSLRIDDKPVGKPQPRTLRAAGKEGSVARVRFFHSFSRAGAATGTVQIDGDDDLATNNSRRFSLRIGGKVSALVVRGPAGELPALDPAVALRFALDPYGEQDAPWSIVPKIVEAAQFGEQSLAGVSCAMLSDVPSFTPQQAAALKDFVARGGTLVIFLGPSVQAASYNSQLGEGLLGGVLKEPVGEVGSAADAFTTHRIDTSHPYFAGLYENFADYPAVVVYRYFPLQVGAGGKVLIQLSSGDPLLASRKAGQGTVALCTSTASPRWTNLPATGLFLPMVSRMCLLAASETGGDNTYQADSQVTLRPDVRLAAGGKAALTVTMPPGRDGKPRTARLDAVATPAGPAAVFADTATPGLYTWQLAQPAQGQTAAGGEFIVNPAGAEANLAAMDPRDFTASLARRGLVNVYVGRSTADVDALAASAAAGHNWWDVLVAVVIVLLVAEAIVANRRRMTEDVVPAHLNPRVTHTAASV